VTSPAVSSTILIVPGLRDHVEDHWQTLLAARLPKARIVPPLETNKLNCRARVDAIQCVMDAIKGPIILVAHSAGCLMLAHWASLYRRPIKGALLVTPPDLYANWPENYPSSMSLRDNGWAPLPRRALPFRSIVIASTNDHLAEFDAVKAMAEDWHADLVNLGPVGHLNPASGYGPWPQAEVFIHMLDQT